MPTAPSSMVPPYSSMPAASAMAATCCAACSPPDCSVLTANTSAAASRASANAEMGPVSDSSAITAMGWRPLSRAMASADATGCSTSSQPASARPARPCWASSSLQAMFTSTRTAPRSPRAFLMAATWATSAATLRRPIFSLKVLCRRSASMRSASSMSLAVSPEASVQATGRLSRTRPPSSCDTGSPVRWPSASNKAVSTAHLAKRFSLMALLSLAMRAGTWLASAPTSNGAK